MFSVADIITICIIVILFFFLFFLFLIEKKFAKSRNYLRTVIFLIIFIAIIQELTFLKIYNLVTWIFPLTFAGLFSVYPLVYLHSRDLVFNIKAPKASRLYAILVIPSIVLIFVSILYYPLDYNSKVKIVSYHILEEQRDIKEFNMIQYFLIPLYYAQTIFYLLLSLKLIWDVKKSIKPNPWDLLLIRYILVFVFAVFFYESILIINSIIFINNLIVLWTVEQFLSLLFLSLCIYIGLQQSLIIIQSRITKYSEKLEVQNEPKQVKYTLLNSEKHEIKEAIENYFNDTKIYLDPNLKLELLSKRIHITSRRISVVINEIYGTNFNHFINEYRISEAKKLMAANPANIKMEDIYIKSGFNSRSAFNHAFKESTGISPIDYIKGLMSKQSA